MTIYDEVKLKLELHPEFRERRLRSKYLAILALRACGLEGRYNAGFQLQLSDMADFGVSFDSYRRAWTEVTKNHKGLQGADYEDKKALEQEHILSVGTYEVGFHQNVKVLERLSP